MNQLHDKYWADLPVEDLVPELDGKIDAYYQWVQASGRRALWGAAFTEYNATLVNGADINYSGEQGQYHMMNVNQLRNIVKHVINMTVSQRPAFEPRATNTDADSQKATHLARGLLNYYLREKTLERKIRTALEYASLYGEGFVTATWNPSDGNIIAVDPETGVEVKEGDMLYETFEPMDVVRDLALTTTADATWWMLKRFRNRWDLVARFPEHRDIILAQQTTRDPLRNFRLGTELREYDTDMIEVWEFYHARTPALPQGRYTMFLYDGVALLDSALPYRNMPVYRLSADDIGGQPFGYGTVFDLLPVQEAVNAAYSIIQTNQASFGVQNIIAPKGANLSPVQLTDGLNLIEYNNIGNMSGKPEALSLVATAPEIFNHLNKLESAMEQLAGINSVIRGEPPSAGMSGSAMALLQSQAVQFVQGLQENYVRMVEDLGTATIATLQDYAITERVASIVGKANRSQLVAFKGDNLKGVNRVQVDIGNPMTRTTAGKLQIAQDLLQNKLIKNAQEYLSVLETGNLETLTEGPMNELLAIRAENEELSDGNSVPVLVTDNHPVHLLEHKAILSDPAIRKDAIKMQAAMEHIQEHYRLWTDPANAGLMACMGIDPPPAGAGQGAPGQVPEGAVPNGAPVGGPAPEEMPNPPNMPSLPPGAQSVPGAAVTE